MQASTLAGRYGMDAIWLAAGAAVGWGVADYFGGASRGRTPVLVVVAVSEVLGLCLLIPVLVARGVAAAREPAPATCRTRRGGRHGRARSHLPRAQPGRGLHHRLGGRARRGRRRHGWPVRRRHARRAGRSRAGLRPRRRGRHRVDVRRPQPRRRAAPERRPVRRRGVRGSRHAHQLPRSRPGRPLLGNRRGARQHGAVRGPDRVRGQPRQSPTATAGHAACGCRR